MDDRLPGALARLLAAIPHVEALAYLFAAIPQVEALAHLLAAIPQVEAVALGGSQVTGQSDATSDIDLYVYSTEPVPAEPRAALAARRGRRVEIDNRFWEPGDEWDEEETGLHVDVVYRDLAATREDLARVLDRHEPSMGYTTCLWHNVLTSRVLFDRRGLFAGLQDVARRPYPDALARAIVARNRPLLRDSFGAFGGQMLKAASRGDSVALNYRTAAFLASYFDVVFAANHAPHPGEKRLVLLAGSLPRPPPDMAQDVEALLAARSGPGLAGPLDSLTDNLDELLRERGYLG